MKILFVSNCYPSKETPQYCIFLEQQAIALQKMGCEVQIFHISETNALGKGQITFNGIKVYRTFPRRGKTKFDLLIPRRLTPVNYCELEKVIIDGFDVVSFQMGGIDLLLTAHEICKHNHIPLIRHFHGLNIWKDYYDKYPLFTIYQNLYRLFYYKKLSATVSVSEKVRGVFCSKIKNVPSFTVYNGVDIERFKYTNDRKFFDGNEIHILCVANMIPIKGQKYLIEAAIELQKMKINVSLTFAGCGPDELTLRELAGKNKVKAFFSGYLPYDYMPKLMQTHDLFIMPSFFEALGCVYLEAMASGMITVGVIGQGIDEVIVDGENGFLVEPQSSESIVAAVNRIKSMPFEELKRVSNEARKTSMNYTWNKSAGDLIKVYKEVKNNIYFY